MNGSPTHKSRHRVRYSHPSPFGSWWMGSLVLLILLGIVGCVHCPFCGNPWKKAKVVPPIAVAEMREATGTVACLERLVLLPTFELRVRLVSLSSADDQSACVIAQQVIQPVTALPTRFAFEYDHAQLDSSQSYGLEAELWAQDKRLFKTDTQYRIRLDDTAAKADLVLMREP